MKKLFFITAIILSTVFFTILALSFNGKVGFEMLEGSIPVMLAAIIFFGMSSSRSETSLAIFLVGLIVFHLYEVRLILIIGTVMLFVEFFVFIYKKLIAKK